MILLAWSALNRIAVPAAAIIALLVGMLFALRSPGRLQVGALWLRWAEAVAGTAVGVTLAPDTFSTLSEHWVAVAVATFGIILGAVVLGLIPVLSGHMDIRTGLYSAIPGGAIGILAMARAHGADDRLVALSQYLRVLAISMLTPLMVAAFATIDQGSGPSLGPSSPVTLPGLGITALILGAGITFGPRLSMPGATLLLPLLLAGVLSAFFPHLTPSVPALLVGVAFGVICLDIGLRFTPAAFRQARSLLPWFALILVLLIVGCAALAFVISRTSTLSLLDAYLATTPGVLAVVAATAHDAGADTGLIVAMQAIRLIANMALVPYLFLLILRFTDGPSRTRGPSADAET